MLVMVQLRSSFHLAPTPFHPAASLPHSICFHNQSNRNSHDAVSCDFSDILFEADNTGRRTSSFQYSRKSAQACCRHSKTTLKSLQLCVHFDQNATSLSSAQPRFRSLQADSQSETDRIANVNSHVPRLEFDSNMATILSCDYSKLLPTHTKVPNKSVVRGLSRKLR